MLLCWSSSDNEELRKRDHEGFIIAQERGRIAVCKKTIWVLSIQGVIENGCLAEENIRLTSPRPHIEKPLDLVSELDPVLIHSAFLLRERDAAVWVFFFIPLFVKHSSRNESTLWHEIQLGVFLPYYLQPLASLIWERSCDVILKLHTHRGVSLCWFRQLRVLLGLYLISAFLAALSTARLLGAEASTQLSPPLISKRHWLWWYFTTGERISKLDQISATRSNCPSVHLVDIIKFETKYWKWNRWVMGWSDSDV